MPYKFHQLSSSAKKHCLTMQKKYTFKTLTDQQIIEKIKDWDFNRKGEIYNLLTS